ncbi:MAG: DUF5103 domain-containing protein [Bacteroidota bacterium]|nr:DUF5103 domain-containing protein [Bacteroidota bacterium]
MNLHFFVFLAIIFTSCKTPALSQTGSSTVTRATVGKIYSDKLYRSGDQTSFPILTLGSTDYLELHFDDLDGDIKNYYYSFQLCNADWSPSVLHPFEYTKGFQNIRITTYRNSSIASTRYTHYQANVPDRNSFPNRSGNYLLKVFINNDTAKLAFTKRFVIVDSKAKIAAQIQQPFNAAAFRTHQKLQIVVTTDNRLQNFNPQDLKVVILQNNNWQTSTLIERPTIFRGNYFEYSDEAITALPAAKEWRWLDMRSLRLQSDRMQRIDTRKDTTEVWVQPEGSRTGQVYVYYRDMNGMYAIETMESINPFWQGEYGWVNFTYVPQGGRAFTGRDVYVFGELTGYTENGRGRMQFNSEEGVYQARLYLKQGFYNYMYVTYPTGIRDYPDFSETEGNNWTTENAYTVLIYFRPFGARADELIGSANLNSTFPVR